MESLQEQILEAWLQLTTSINNERIVTNLPFNEILIYRFLVRNRNQEITATDLCQFIKMQKSQMNRTLTSMEEKNLIVRKRSEFDRRKILIQTISETEEIYQQEHKRIIRIVDTLIQRVGKEKAKQAQELFLLIASIAKEEQL